MRCDLRALRAAGRPSQSESPERADEPNRGMMSASRVDEPNRGVMPASTAAPFSLRVSPGPDAVITVSGELDMVSAPVFEASVRELDLRALKSAVLDLESLEFLDARGLRAVLYLHAACRSLSVGLLIEPGPRRVQRIFELTGTDRVLPFSRR